MKGKSRRKFSQVTTAQYNGELRQLFDEEISAQHDGKCSL